MHDSMAAKTHVKEQSYKVICRWYETGNDALWGEGLAYNITTILTSVQ